MSVRSRRRRSLEELAPYLLEAPEPPALFSWENVFGNDQPVEIEVGFGKGLFLLSESERCPTVNFLGIEIVRKYQLFTATRMAVRQRSNVRLACADARQFLRSIVPPASVQAVHVYFPDPWWKTRHHKRRLFTPEFATVAEQVLRPAGRLYVVTDVADYFAVMRTTVAEHTRLQELPPPDPKEPGHDMDYLTNFERKFRKEGKPIFRATYERPEVSSESPLAHDSTR